LRLASNLEVAQIDAAVGHQRPRFNSTTSNKLLVLIDGRTVYTPSTLGVLDVQDILLEDIDRIEVISGRGHFVGSNAVNGVINITTKRPQETKARSSPPAAAASCVTSARFATAVRSANRLITVCTRSVSIGPHGAADGTDVSTPGPDQEVFARRRLSANDTLACRGRIRRADRTADRR